MSTNEELFNTHQEDVRRRADSLVRAMFVLAGGALTVSIGLLTSPIQASLNSCLVTALQSSWWGLFLSIIFLVLALVTIIGRDYAFGEKWRRQLKGEDCEVTSPVWCEYLIWQFAILGLLCFILGMLGLAYVASSLISHA